MRVYNYNDEYIDEPKKLHHVETSDPNFVPNFEGKSRKDILDEWTEICRKSWENAKVTRDFEKMASETFDSPIYKKYYKEHYDNHIKDLREQSKEKVRKRQEELLNTIRPKKVPESKNFIAKLRRKAILAGMDSKLDRYYDQLSDSSISKVHDEMKRIKNMSDLVFCDTAYTYYNFANKQAAIEVADFNKQIQDRNKLSELYKKEYLRKNPIGYVLTGGTLPEHKQDKLDRELETMGHKMGVSVNAREKDKDRLKVEQETDKRKLAFKKPEPNTKQINYDKGLVKKAKRIFKSAPEWGPVLKGDDIVKNRQARKERGWKQTGSYPKNK